MAPKKRSLADELAELINPAPQSELDPETGFGEGAVLNESDEELDAAAQAPTRRAREQGLRLRGDIELDAAYRGRRTSRAAVFGEADQEGFGAEGAAGDAGSSEDDHDMEGETEEEGEEEGEEEEEEGVEMLGNGHMLDGSDEGEEGESDSEADDEECKGEEAAGVQRQQRPQQQQAGRAAANGHAQAGSSSGSDEDDNQVSHDQGFGHDADEDGDDVAARLASAHGAGTSGQDAEMQDLERQYAQMQQEGAQAQLLSRQRAKREQAKGRAVKAQRSLWESALEVRIMLQRCVTGGNRMPRPGARAAVVGAHEQLARKYSELLQGCQETISTLLELHTDLLAQHPAAAAAAAAATTAPAAAATSTKKRARTDEADETDGPSSSSSADAMWARIESAHAAFAPFCDSALDRWHRRTALLSGNAALKGGGALRALNQSVSAQVGAMMRDKVKLIARTRLPAAQVQRPLLANTTTTPPAANGNDDTTHPDHHPFADSTNADEDDLRDAETFDDGELYAQLLKEFLDAGGAGAGAAAAAARGPKRRKLVDRRASKGRKLRYQVMEKLVNFMAPEEKPLPVFAKQLFANLFGHGGAA